MDDRYSLISYNHDELVSSSGTNLDAILGGVNNGRYSWLVMDGYSEVDRPAIEKILTFFAFDLNFADTVLEESCQNFQMRTKDFTIVSYAIPILDEATGDYSQVCGSLLFSKNVMLLFACDQSDFYQHVVDKVMQGQSSAQEFGTDYLFYLLIRSIIKQSKQFIIFDLTDQFETAEDAVIDNPGEEFVLDDILALRQRVRPLHDAVYHLRELIDFTLEEENQFITPHIRDLFAGKLEKDAQELWLGYQQLRDWSSTLMDIHRANVAEKTNRIIHILTILSFIFLPITFLSSLYGMNFTHMPELNGRYSYFITLGLMTLIVFGLVSYMKRKQWI